VKESVGCVEKYNPDRRTGVPHLAATPEHGAVLFTVRTVLLTKHAFS
jgi:hypothetical protein